jgi:prolyl 4-hydroxylase
MQGELGIERFLCDTVALPGYHMLVFEVEGDCVSVAGYKDSLALNFVSFGGYPVKDIANDTMFRGWLQSELKISAQTNEWPPELKQPWACFTALGQRLNSAQEVVQAKEVFILEGGQFLWPPVRLGHKAVLQGLPGIDGMPLEIETLCIQPLVFEVKNFLKNEECDYIIQQAEPAMVNSEVYQNDADIGKPSTEWRTSTQTWLRSANNPLLTQIDNRVAALTRVPMSHQEDVQVEHRKDYKLVQRVPRYSMHTYRLIPTALYASSQVLRYQTSQKYNVHLDAFDPSLYASQAERLRMIDYGHKNRLATVFWYY